VPWRWLPRLRGEKEQPSTAAPTQGDRDQDDDDLSPRQVQESRWATQGWTAVWEPTAAVKGGSRARLWACRGEDALLRLFPGPQPPSQPVDPLFYVNDGRVYRDEGHPDGPSSVPWYVITAGRVYPAEGYPTGAADRIHYEVKPIRSVGRHVRVRPNPSFGEADS
jgi:hypothetical protein